MAENPPQRPEPSDEDNLLSRRRAWRPSREPDPHTDGPDDDTDEALPDPRAIDLVLRVGELMLASGESTEAVSEAMLSLSVAFELPRTEVSVTFTVIYLSSHPTWDNPPITVHRLVRRLTRD